MCFVHAFANVSVCVGLCALLNTVNDLTCFIYSQWLFLSYVEASIASTPTVIPFITDVICNFFLKKDSVNRNSKTKIHVTHVPSCI